MYTWKKSTSPCYQALECLSRERMCVEYLDAWRSDVRARIGREMSALLQRVRCATLVYGFFLLFCIADLHCWVQRGFFDRHLCCHESPAGAAISRGFEDG